mgnify:CR=1 FL=1
MLLAVVPRTHRATAVWRVGRSRVEASATPSCKRWKKKALESAGKHWRGRMFLSMIALDGNQPLRRRAGR